MEREGTLTEGTEERMTSAWEQGQWPTMLRGSPVKQRREWASAWKEGRALLLRFFPSFFLSSFLFSSFLFLSSSLSLSLFFSSFLPASLLSSLPLVLPSFFKRETCKD